MDDPKTDPMVNPDARPLGAGPTPTPSPTPEEIREAVADVAWKKQTNPFGVWFAVESAHQNSMSQENIVALTEIKKTNDTIVTTALDVVASGG